MAHPEYPKRPSHFAHKAVRAMFKTCVAQEHGQGVFAILCLVAHTEDARHYSSPVTFWNEQLASLAGFANAKAMDRQRAKAIAAGWLVYIPGGNRTPGKYWITIPPQFADLDDAPSDEGLFWSDPESTTEKVQTSNLTNEVGIEPGMNRERSGNRTGNEPGMKWEPFYPVPNPIPVPENTECPEPASHASGPADAKGSPPKPARGPKRPEPAAVSEKPPDAVLAFPVVGGRGGAPPEWWLSATKLAEWQESFPGVDVLTECRKARQWCSDNPTRRKTAKGMTAFLFSWLSRCQNRGPAQTEIHAPASNASRGGGSREHQRQDANKAAIAGFLQSHGVRPGAVGIDVSETNVRLHGGASQRLVLRHEAIPGEGHQPGGCGAGHIADAVPGTGGSVLAVPAENAKGVLPDGG